MGRTNKDNKYKDYRSDKARKFNKDEKRKQKHERDALRSGNVEKLVDVEDETGNTFYSTGIIEKESNKDLWPRGCPNEEAFEREIDAFDRSEYEHWLEKQNGRDGRDD
jgi:hypothetical protein